ncbi:MAG: M48 family metalloprotease [Gammaproteobacteria bacterium]|nr:M48 family metalloprotease [Gammaproteobacteria bacterium]MBU0787213.1 M48 family metalloprotease [Gammaproteobacteria bacterium]MBU0814220.1 M48 family metalloprotease [Gammaproteobacteria bacterium]MBU1786260.1 M48 family metalloprotease [Gammaproteobacteria bacterium]
MVKFFCIAFGMLPMMVATAAQPVQLAYEPVGLGWSAAEVERASSAQMDALTERAHKAGQLGCSAYCDCLHRVFSRLVVEARTQTERSATLPWSLLVLRLPDIKAMAMPDGQLAISETFVDGHLPSEDALAFVLAHEMAHSILEHERQALTFARLLLPRQIVRSVKDMYVEMDFNLSLLMAMEPVMQQGEYEADELGMLLASKAGYDPDRQLAFISSQCQSDADSVPLVATHPPACQRLQRLQSLLPLARRQRPTFLH